MQHDNHYTSVLVVLHKIKCMAFVIWHILQKCRGECDKCTISSSSAKWWWEKFGGSWNLQPPPHLRHKDKPHQNLHPSWESFHVVPDQLFQEGVSQNKKRVCGVKTLPDECVCWTLNFLPVPAASQKQWLLQKHDTNTRLRRIRWAFTSGRPFLHRKTIARSLLPFLPQRKSVFTKKLLKD